MKLERVSWKVGRLLAVSLGMALLIGLCVGLFSMVGIHTKEKIIYVFSVVTLVSLLIITPSGLLFGAIANYFGWMNLKSIVITSLLIALPLIVISGLFYYLAGYAEVSLIGWIVPLGFGSSPIVGLFIFYKFYLQHVYQPVKDTPSK
jgi:hypothetical protein